MRKIDRVKEEISKALDEHYKSSPIYFEIILEIPIYWQGWELDETAYVVTTSKNERLLINSNHGSLYVDPKGLEFLKEKIKEYQNTSSTTQKAIDLLKKDKKS